MPHTYYALWIHPHPTVPYIDDKIDDIGIFSSRLPKLTLNFVLPFALLHIAFDTFSPMVTGLTGYCVLQSWGRELDPGSFYWTNSYDQVPNPVVMYKERASIISEMLLSSDRAGTLCIYSMSVLENITNDLETSMCQLEKFVYCKCIGGKEHEFLLFHFCHPMQQNAEVVLVSDRIPNPIGTNNDNDNEDNNNNNVKMSIVKP
ncbi:hypothetical protein BDR07DRAFT_1375577 [Suillus spraguei]|nr:hypothetical protein BDR07DRAFT_1375577 [Suillus spraguei]